MQVSHISHPDDRGCTLLHTAFTILSIDKLIIFPLNINRIFYLSRALYDSGSWYSPPMSAVGENVLASASEAI